MVLAAFTCRRVIPETAMDTAALDEMRELLGEEKTLALLADLATDFRSRFESGKAEDVIQSAFWTPIVALRV